MIPTLVLWQQPTLLEMRFYIVDSNANRQHVFRNLREEVKINK
jgi:hypothetical protein